MSAAAAIRVYDIAICLSRIFQERQTTDLNLELDAILTLLLIHHLNDYRVYFNHAYFNYASRERSTSVKYENLSGLFN